MELNGTSGMRATDAPVRHEPGRAPVGVMKVDTMTQEQSAESLNDPDHLVLAMAAQTPPTVCLMKVVGPCEGQTSVSDRSWPRQSIIVRPALPPLAFAELDLNIQFPQQLVPRRAIWRSDAVHTRSVRQKKNNLGKKLRAQRQSHDDVYITR